MSDHEDINYVRDCLAGDSRAFQALVSKYQKTMFNTVLRLVQDYDDAKDVTQAAFIKCYEHLGSYNSSYKFFSWLYRIVVNESLNFNNSRKRIVPIDSYVVSAEENPESVYRTRETQTKLQETLNELKNDYRTVIVLKHFEQLSYQEISDILHIPVKTVRSRLFTARKLLRDGLSNKGID